MMRRTYATGVTSRCDAVCVSEISGEAAGSTRQWAGTGTCGLVAKSATGVFRILPNSLVRRIIGRIGIVDCSLPVGGVGLGIGMAGRVGAVP